MDTVVLDQSSEPWVATFAGLGSVAVDADGAIDVNVAHPANTPAPPHEGVTPDDAEEARQREQALRFGWGEPLSLVRRGFRLLWGTAVVPPRQRGCLVLTGGASHTGLVTSRLLSAGWRPLADGIVPVAADATGAIDTTGTGGRVVAHPRSAPVVLPRRLARSAGLDGQPVRADTDAVAVAVNPVADPEPVMGIAAVRARRPHDPVVRQFGGFELFEQAAAVLMGVETLCPTTIAPATELANHRRLATIAHAEVALSYDTLADDLATLISWWDELGQP